MSSTLEFDLLHNALDFVSSAVELSLKGDTRSLKYAILHLDAAIELLLKARLAKEHWSLIFMDPDKANLKDMKAGSFISVDVKSALKRLEGIIGLAVSDADKKRIQALRDHRNRIQHFAIIVPAQTVKALLAFGCNFILDFCHKELPEDIKAGGSMLDGMVERLTEFKEFVRERMASLDTELKKLSSVVWCPDCNQEALAIGLGEQPRCLFCAESKPTLAVATLLSETDVRTCPECGEEALILHVLNNEEAENFCVYCGTEGHYHECSNCGEMYSGDGPMCKNCWDNLLERND
jgi:hypothetical protein